MELKDVKASDWKRLYYLVPEEFKRLVMLCHEFEEFEEYLERIGRFVTGRDIQRLQIMMQRILGEYFRLLRKYKEMQDLREVKSDILSALSRLFDERGRARELSRDLIVPITRGEIHFYLPMFLSNFKAFVITNIYDALLETISIIESNFGELFSNISCSKCGLLPEIVFEKGKKLEWVKKEESEKKEEDENI